MAEITSDSFDATNAGFNALSSDTTRIYYDGDMTVSAEGEPTAPANTRTDFSGAFSDDLPFTLVVPRLAIGTTELNTLRNGTIITTDGAPNFGTAADYTFTVACNVDWENINFMCSNGGTNGWGLAGSGATVRPVGRVENCTFGTTAMTEGGGGDIFTDSTYDISIGSGSTYWIASSTITFAELQTIFPIGTVIVEAPNAAAAATAVQRTVTGHSNSSSNEGLQVGGGFSPNTTAGNNIYIVTTEPATDPVPEGLWFVNLANVDASFVFANNAFDAAVLNTAAAGNYVIGLAFAGTTRAQGANNLYTMRINNFTSVGPWTVVMNNSFANNAAAPYAVGAGAAGIVHYQSNGYPGAGLSVLLINERYEGNNLFLSRRGGGVGTYISTYAWNPTFITPASATIADVKLLGVGSNNIYQVPTGTTDRSLTFDAAYPSISDGTIVSSSNGYLVQVGDSIETQANDVVSTAPAVRDFVTGDLIATPVVLRAKSYTHLVDTTVTSDLNALENSGGNSGAFSFTESNATTADVDTALIAGTFAATRALDGSAVAHNEGAALYSRLKADWYGEDGLNEPLTSFANTATAQTISSTHNIVINNTVGSVSVDATSGIVIPASAGITGDATYNTISTTGTINISVPSTNMSLSTGTSSFTIGATSISGGALTGIMAITDGATFNNVEFNGTLFLYSGTQLDLSTCTFGSTFSASNGTGKTVTLPLGTSQAIQDIFTDGGWTVVFPAIEYDIAFPPQVGNYIISIGSSIVTGVTTTGSSEIITISDAAYTNPNEVTIYWTGSGFTDVVQVFTGMNVTIGANPDVNVADVTLDNAVTAVYSTTSGGDLLVTGVTASDEEGFAASFTNKYWDRVKSSNLYTQQVRRYNEAGGDLTVPLIRFIDSTRTQVNRDYIKFASGTVPARREAFTNLALVGTEPFTEQATVQSGQVAVATQGSYTSLQAQADFATAGLSTDNSTRAIIDEELDAGKLTRVGRPS